MSPLLIGAVANQAQVTAHFAQYVIERFRAGVDTCQAVDAYRIMTGVTLPEADAYAVLAAWRQLRPDRAA